MGMSAVESDDLYKDLNETLFNKKKLKSDGKSIILGKNATEFIDGKYVVDLRQQITNLQEENETLKRNIGTLFRTAKGEITRKDSEIARLQGKIQFMNRNSNIN